MKLEKQDKEFIKSFLFTAFLILPAFIFVIVFLNDHSDQIKNIWASALTYLVSLKEFGLINYVKTLLTTRLADLTIMNLLEISAICSASYFLSLIISLIFIKNSDNENEFN